MQEKMYHAILLFVFMNSKRQLHILHKVQALINTPVQNQSDTTNVVAFNPLGTGRVLSIHFLHTRHNFVQVYHVIP